MPQPRCRAGSAACAQRPALPRARATPLRLPAGAAPQEVMIGADRFAIPEVLFNPALLAAHYPAAADALKV